MEDLHPAIRAFRVHRRNRRLAGEEWLTGCMTGADGRIHPSHHQLGAATGRNTCTAPNLVGIGRVLRPVVTAPPGRALIELDYSQIEVGVAAAEHDDPDLIAAFNSGDVYSAMAQRFYASDLSEGERALQPREFKAKRRDLRDAMKLFVLAVIYNIQAPALAVRFGISVAQAERERQRFLDLFPTLQRRLEESVAYGAVHGYATCVSGLRRLVESKGRPSTWTRNFLRNTPIQGSAAVVFKRAVNALDQAFRGTGVWLVLPVHDAIVIECPEAEVEEVAARAAQIMEDALRATYPSLQPRVEINKSHPECWNKDGHADSLERFLQDPTFRLDGRPHAIEEPHPPDDGLFLPEWVTNSPSEDATVPNRLTVDDLLAVVGDRGRQLDLHAWIEQYEERAAIQDFEGGLSRAEAEEQARASTLRSLREFAGITDADVEGEAGG
ncbi:MAG: DNA polymerase [Candidatus Eiseniibacteriota bacterium]